MTGLRSRCGRDLNPVICRTLIRLRQSLAALRTVVRTSPVAARPGSGPGRGRRLKSRVRVGPGEPWPTIIRAPSALPTARGRLPYARGRCQCRRRHRIIMVRMVPLTGSGPALVSSLTRRSAVVGLPRPRSPSSRWRSDLPALGTSPGPGRTERTGSPRSADRQLEVSRGRDQALPLARACAMISAQWWDLTPARPSA
jgi:hypothetical protein